MSRLLYFNFIFAAMWLLVFSGTSLHATVPWAGLQFVIKGIYNSHTHYDLVSPLYSSIGWSVI